MNYKIGDIVRCIAGDQKYPLTKGKEYKVINAKDNGTFNGIEIINDDGFKRKYKEKYFILVQPSNLKDELRRFLL